MEGHRFGGTTHGPHGEGSPLKTRSQAVRILAVATLIGIVGCSGDDPVAPDPVVEVVGLQYGGGTFDQVKELEPVFEDILHSFADHDKVIDVRNIGLMGAIEMAPRDGALGARGLDVHKTCFWEEDLVVRNGMVLYRCQPGRF